MNIEESEKAGVTILRISGSMDLAFFPRLEEAIKEVHDREIQRVIVILNEVTMITSRGVGAFVKMSKDLGARGGRLIIAEPSEACDQVLDLLRLKDFFHVTGTEAEALNLFDG